MYNIIEQISDDSFLYLQPWFYNNQLALRCELGIGEDKYMENAFSRAIQIASILFENRKIDAAFFNQYFEIYSLPQMILMMIYLLLKDVLHMMLISLLWKAS